MQQMSERSGQATFEGEPMAMWTCPSCRSMTNMPRCPLCNPPTPHRRPRSASKRRSGVTATSRAAYADLKANNVERQRQKVLAAIDAAPAGLTRLDLADVTGIPINTICPTVFALLGRDRHYPELMRNPILAELPVPRLNQRTGARAAVLVRTERRPEFARGLFDVAIPESALSKVAK